MTLSTYDAFLSKYLPMTKEEFGTSLEKADCLLSRSYYELYRETSYIRLVLREANRDKKLPSSDEEGTGFFPSLREEKNQGWWEPHAARNTIRMSDAAANAPLGAHHR